MLKFISAETSPKVIGILNITPDSFYTKGRCFSAKEALIYAKKMEAEGAALIDIGAEATNPSLISSLSVQEELERLLPVLDLLTKEIQIPLSVDTSQPEVMYEAVKRGVSLINDIRAFRNPGALSMVAQLKVPICIMHMAYPYAETEFGNEDNLNIVHRVKNFLEERILACFAAGIPSDHIIIDPGFGHGKFGKNLSQNLQLLKYLSEFKCFGLPILVGLSRKTFIGELLNVPVEERLAGSLAAAVMAVERGAAFIRVHDVKATVQAIHLVTSALKESI